MKIIASAALAAVTVLGVLGAFASGGCQHQAQPLETLPQRKPAEPPAAASGAAAPAAAGSPATAAGTAAPDRSGTLEARMARIEDALARNAEALEFLNKVYAQQKLQQKQQQEQADRDDPAPDAVFAIDVTEDVQGGQVDGPATAAVTIVKAFDFACPYCRKVAPTMDELVKDYAGKVRVVYTNMVIHPPARPAHLASCAAAKQGKYKQFKDAFWDKGYDAYAATSDLEKLGEDNIVAIAKELGLDTAKLKADMASPACAARVEHDQQQMSKFHINSTPTFFINGKVITGAQPKGELKRRIDDELAIVARSGVPAAQYYGKVVVGGGEKQFRSKSDPKPAGK